MKHSFNNSKTTLNPAELQRNPPTNSSSINPISQMQKQSSINPTTEVQKPLSMNQFLSVVEKLSADKEAMTGNGRVDMSELVSALQNFQDPVCPAANTTSSKTSATASGKTSATTSDN